MACIYACVHRVSYIFAGCQCDVYLYPYAQHSLPYICAIVHIPIYVYGRCAVWVVQLSLFVFTLILKLFLSFLSVLYLLIYPILFLVTNFQILI